jgi:hypothetical protein
MAALPAKTSSGIPLGSDGDKPLGNRPKKMNPTPAARIVEGGEVHGLIR